MTLPTEEKQKPSIWNQALKAVKGENTHDLVEQFTAEMTLVAEGLCEDQARLRGAVEGLIREGDTQRAKQDQDYQELCARLDAAEKENDRRLREISRRLDAIERGAKQKPRLFGGDVLGRVTVLVGIVCITWLAVTALQLFL